MRGEVGGRGKKLESGNLKAESDGGRGERDET